MADVITNYLKQEENFLVATKPVKLVINLDDYKLDHNLTIDEENKKINVESLVSTAEFEDKIFNVVLDYPASIWFSGTDEEPGYEKTDTTIEVSYGAGETVLEVTMAEENIEEQVKYVERLLGGKEIYKDTTHLYNKLAEVYFPVSDADSVHFEVLLSQVLRDKGDISQPARLGKTWNPTMTNIKDIVFKSNFMSGLAFEDINKATKTGLTTEDEPEPSVIEKLMRGTLE